LGSSKDLRDTRDREIRDRETRDIGRSRDSGFRDSGFRDSGFRDSKEEPKRPKLTSAIVSSIPVVGEKPRPALDTSGEETKKRSKKLFGLIVGTLKSFKEDISTKSKAVQRREELEQKVQQKVKEEQESFKEQERRTLQEKKEKEVALREQIRQQQEQKELQLLNLKWDHHRSQLIPWNKTAAQPPIYYRAAKVDPNERLILEEEGKKSVKENESMEEGEKNREEEKQDD